MHSEMASPPSLHLSGGLQCSLRSTVEKTHVMELVSESSVRICLCSSCKRPWRQLPRGRPVTGPGSGESSSSREAALSASCFSAQPWVVRPKLLMRSVSPHLRRDYRHLCSLGQSATLAGGGQSFTG